MINDQMLPIFINIFPFLDVIYYSACRQHRDLFYKVVNYWSRQDSRTIFLLH